MVELDRVRALPFRKYLRLRFGISVKQWRKKLPRTFKCDCGWRHKWGWFELERWDAIHEITCHDCGSVYRTQQGSIVRVTPNPLGRFIASSPSPDLGRERGPASWISRWSRRL